MSTESALLEGLATYLDAQGVADYRPSGGYVSSDTAIVFGPLQTDPDRQVALTVYDSTDYVRQSISTFRVQLFMRGVVDNTLDAANLASDIFDVLQGVEDVDWGDLRLIQARRLVVSDQNVDANLRAERADSYEFRVSTPATSRRF